MGSESQSNIRWLNYYRFTQGCRCWQEQMKPQTHGGLHLNIHTPTWSYSIRTMAPSTGQLWPQNKAKQSLSETDFFLCSLTSYFALDCSSLSVKTAVDQTMCTQGPFTSFKCSVNWHGREALKVGLSDSAHFWHQRGVRGKRTSCFYIIRKALLRHSDPLKQGCPNFFILYSKAFIFSAIILVL